MTWNSGPCLSDGDAAGGGKREAGGMSRLREFVTGWAVTLRIMLFERETYRLLRDWHDLDEFVEAAPPGNSPDSYRWAPPPPALACRTCPDCGRCLDCYRRGEDR